MELAQDIRLSSQEWDAFRRGYSPFRFEAVVDRGELGFPTWFMPNARGAVIPSARVLKPISSRRVRPGFWLQITKDVFRWYSGQITHTCMRFGRLWSIVCWFGHPTTLTFYCGSTPVMFRTYREAMWFFRHFWDQKRAGRDVISPLGYCWTPILPSFPDPAALDELTAYKDCLEAADRAFWIKYDKDHGRGPALAA